MYQIIECYQLFPLIRTVSTGKHLVSLNWSIAQTQPEIVHQFAAKLNVRAIDNLIE